MKIHFMVDFSAKETIGARGRAVQECAMAAEIRPLALCKKEAYRCLRWGHTMLRPNLSEDSRGESFKVCRQQVLHLWIILSVMEMAASKTIRYSILSKVRDLKGRDSVPLPLSPWFQGVLNIRIEFFLQGLWAIITRLRIEGQSRLRICPD